MLKEFVCDTNVVQSLYIILSQDKNRLQMLKDKYNREQLYCLASIAENMDMFTLYVTPTIMEELEAGEKRNPGIVRFAAQNFKMRMPLKYDNRNLNKNAMVESLTRLYLTKNLHLSDNTKGKVAAMEPEIKNGESNIADSIIISYNSIVYGLPVLSLNEKHMVSIDKYIQKINKMGYVDETIKKTNRFRSVGILLDNEKFLEENLYRLPTYAKTNLRKPTASTFKVTDINKNLRSVSTLLGGSGMNLVDDESDNKF